MNVTPEERERRAERSRRNGACSRGPTSRAGRDRVKLNALSDGLTAKTFPLPFERKEAEQRTERWQTYFSSENPAAVHLANECARATIVADRSHSYREARCARQVKNTQRNWDRRRRRRVETIVERGRGGGDRLAALAELGTFAHGCRLVALDLELFLDALRSRGYLEPEELENAIFYQGIWPVTAALATNDTAYTLHTLNLAGIPPGAPAQVAEARVDPVRDQGPDQVGPSGAASVARTYQGQGPPGAAAYGGSVSAPGRAPSSAHRCAGPRVRPGLAAMIVWPAPGDVRPTIYGARGSSPRGLPGRRSVAWGSDEERGSEMMQVPP
jgi:hypothetical protein